MAQGSIKKRQLDDGSVRYDVVVDLGTDPVTGKRRQRKKTFATKREAQAGLTAWQADIDRGLAVDRSTQTITDLLALWLDTHRPNVRPVTLDRYETVIRVHILPYLGHFPMQKLTPATIQKFYSERLRAGIGPRTLRLCHLHLGQAFRMGVRLGLVARDVTQAVTPPRFVPKQMAVWDGEQCRQFLAVAEQSAHGPLWLVARCTGMRRGELLGLRWQDVDWEHGALRIRQTVGLLRGMPDVKQPKTSASLRDVSIQRDVLDALREHKRQQNEQRLHLGPHWRDHDLVFPATTGNPLHPDNLKRDYNRLVKRAGLPRIRIHDLRHSHVTLALQAGANIRAVSERVGHRDISITLGTYAHVLPSQHVEVADKVGAVRFGARSQGASAGRP